MIKGAGSALATVFLVALPIVMMIVVVWAVWHLLT